jgi:hypothetical protein
MGPIFRPVPSALSFESVSRKPLERLQRSKPTPTPWPICFAPTSMVSSRSRTNGTGDPARMMKGRSTTVFSNITASSLPALNSNGREKATPGYCSIADAEWGVLYLIRTIKACGDQSSRWHPKRRGQPVNVMAQAIREVAWNAANDPPKMPNKTGVSRAEIAAHAFECSVGSKGDALVHNANHPRVGTVHLPPRMSSDVDVVPNAGVDHLQRIHPPLGLP